MEKIIGKRLNSSALGFGAEIKSKKEKTVGGVFKEVVAHDFVKYGIVPELVGRLPVITVLDDLTKDYLVRILVEPKNAIVKQYKKLFELDGVELQFDEDALEAVAEKSLDLETGARGLRSIMEKILLPSMFEVPSETEIVGIRITKDCVLKGEKPQYTLGKRISGLKKIA
jgi:ATP-dependent Clp protease ATP-binding subunit ClpX